MIDINKKYKTRGGRDVRIYAMDGNPEYPVHGAILSESGWNGATWCTEGRWLSSFSSPNDLVEVKPTVKVDMWLNLYPNQTAAYHFTRAEADRNAGSQRVACIHIEREVEYGEGL
jgi:hypothetical protein